MEPGVLDEIVKRFFDVFDPRFISYVNITGTSEGNGHNDMYDIIFYNCTSYSYQKFGAEYRKFLKNIAEATNTEIKHNSEGFKGYLYTWSPSYYLKVNDELRFEFGRKYLGKRYIDDVSTTYYCTTNNKHFVELVYNRIKKKNKKIQIKIKNEYTFE